MTTDFETTSYAIGGVDTVVQTIGQGKPVLFLHGAATLEGFDFARDLADRFRLILPSHPGMGLSGPAPHIVDMQDMVVHYLNLLEALNLPEPPHLMGFSMGGWMAATLAGLARGAFDKIVLLAPAGLNDPRHPATPLGTIAAQDFPGYMTHDPAIAARFFPDGRDLAFAQRFTADRAREADMVGRLCAAHGMGHPNLRGLLRRITNPTLLVWGQEDRLLPAAQAPLWCDQLPHARFLALPDTGHLVAQERPESLQAIGDFLAE